LARAVEAAHGVTIAQDWKRKIEKKKKDAMIKEP
jgi:hypothetical protein